LSLPSYVKGFPFSNIILRRVSISLFPAGPVRVVPIIVSAKLFEYPKNSLESW